LTDEVEFRMASRVVVQDHGVTGRENDFTVDDEDGTKGLVTPSMRLFGECQSLAEENFVVPWLTIVPA
jgi:hypothetical protein